MTGDMDGMASPLSFGPQEWQWFLQDQKLISTESTIQWTDDELELAIPGLSPEAILPCRLAAAEEDKIDNMALRVRRGLDWLHRASVYDWVALKEAYDALQSEQRILERQIHLQQEHCKKANEDLTRIAAKLGVDVTAGRTMDVAQRFHEQTRTKQQEKQSVLEKHAEAIRKALDCYTEICSRLQLPFDHVTYLQEWQSGVELNVSQLEDELYELLAFFEARRFNAAQHVPPFMTLVVVDCHLEKATADLKQVVFELKNNSIVDTEYGEIATRVLEARRAHVHLQEAQLDARREQLDKLTTEVEALEQDMKSCRDRMNRVRRSLQHDICQMFEKEPNEIQIVVPE